jgi:hypothetical protein
MSSLIGPCVIFLVGRYARAFQVLTTLPARLSADFRHRKYAESSRQLSLASPSKKKLRGQQHRQQKPMLTNQAAALLHADAPDSHLLACEKRPSIIYPFASRFARRVPVHAPDFQNALVGENSTTQETCAPCQLVSLQGKPNAALNQNKRVRFAE